MTKIKIRLSKSHDQEFDVTLIISNEPEDLRGFLPLQPPDLQSSFNEWLSGYRNLEGVRLELKNVIVSSDVKSKAREVRGLLNEWLNNGRCQWQPIRDKLIEVGSRWQPAKKEEMYIILDFPEEKFIQLGRIPWQEWDLFKNYYSDSEIALRLYGKPGQTILPIQKYWKVRILLVVGRSDNIQTNNDIKIVKKLEKKGAEVTVLLQPTKKKLSEALWQEPGYHIFIFSGHSSCDHQTPINWLELNQQDRISIEDFEIAFGKAIAKGLQLAIFNSCDGLGLAQQLAKLNLPRSIVMRELVPDQVAVEFLEHFFEEFTKNKSLFTSVHIARERLEHFNDRFPNATWLPTLCIRESALHTRFTWNELVNLIIKLPPRILKLLAGLLIVVFAGLLIEGVVIVSLSLIPESCPTKESSFLEFRQQIWKRLFPKKCLAYLSGLPTQRE
ncbi:MAG: CHAT domain-containing protein [Moorea sp. SIO4A3]|nr:CHAT domain-containing protein [Moorena sp. SIO4A3]